MLKEEKSVRFDKYASQALKGIAILMLLMHHQYRETKLFAGYYVSFRPFSREFIVQLSLSFKICVAMFAFISGYGLYCSYRNNKKSANRWVLTREIKMLSGFWAIYILSAVIFQALYGYFEKVYFTKNNLIEGIFAAITDFLGLARIFDTQTMNGTWWYMGMAVIFVLLVPLFMKYEESLPLLLAGVIFLPRVLHIEAMGRSETLAFLPVFVAGMCMAKYDLFDRWLALWNHGAAHVVKFLGMLLLMVFLYISYDKINADTYNEVRWLIFPVVTMLFCVEFITVIPGIRQILLFLGKHSMNIFLVHTFFRHYFYKDFIYSFKWFGFDYLVLLVLSLLVSIVVECLKKITGYNRLIRNICAKI